MIKLTLMNGQEVEVSQEEVNEFITVVLVSNPAWQHSGLLTQEEVTRYLKGYHYPYELKKIALYILIYEENLAFTSYLFDKAEGNPDQSKEFNMPVVKKLRDIYTRVARSQRTLEEVAGDVHEMENTCLETGADPL